MPLDSAGIICRMYILEIVVAVVVIVIEVVSVVAGAAAAATFVLQMFLFKRQNSVAVCHTKSPTTFWSLSGNKLFYTIFFFFTSTT